MALYLTEPYPLKLTTRGLIKKPVPRTRVFVCSPRLEQVENITRALLKGTKCLRARKLIPSILILAEPKDISSDLRHLTFKLQLKQSLFKMVERFTKDKNILLKELTKDKTEALAKLRQLTVKSDYSEQGKIVDRIASKINQLKIVIREIGDENSKVFKDNREDCITNLVKKTQVLLAETCSSFVKEINPGKFEVDTVIIDDADQCNELETLIPSRYKPNGYILLGDSTRATLKNSAVHDKQDINSNSLFYNLWKVSESKFINLENEFRMHPDIFRFFGSDFCAHKDVRSGSKNFLAKGKGWHKPPFIPYQFFEIYSQTVHKSGATNCTDPLEAEAVFQIFKRFEALNTKTTDIAIISPYNEQIELIKKLFGSEFSASRIENTKFYTVDEAFGQEFEIVILSWVKAQTDKNNKTYNIDDRNMYTALSRANLALWIVGTEKELVGNPRWDRLIKDTRVRHFHKNFIADFPSKSLGEIRSSKPSHFPGNSSTEQKIIIEKKGSDYNSLAARFDPKPTNTLEFRNSKSSPSDFQKYPDNSSLAKSKDQNSSSSLFHRINTSPRQKIHNAPVISFKKHANESKDENLASSISFDSKDLEKERDHSTESKLYKRQVALSTDIINDTGKREQNIESNTPEQEPKRQKLNEI